MGLIMIRCVLALLFAASIAPTAQAQSWSTRTNDDGGYAAGFVTFPGLGAGVTCTARSVQNKPIMETSWLETTTADPWHFLLWFDEALIPSTPFKRGDLVLYVDQIGYRLPLSYFNDMEGGWQVGLPMNDQFFAALRNGQRLVLAVGKQRSWELPLNGMSAALDQARAFCAATWAVTGPPRPPGLGQIAVQPQIAPAPQPGVLRLPAQVQNDVNRKCGGTASISPAALAAGDLDRDGQPDVAVDFSGVTCPGGGLNPFCGAANCSVDVYMSSRGYLNPIELLGIGATMVPLPGGGLGV